MSIAFANQYAKALLDAVTSAGTDPGPAQALQQIDDFLQALADSRELREVLNSPAVESRGKKAVIAKLAEAGQFHPLVRNFLFVVAQKRRMGLLRVIRDRFQAQWDAQMGVVRAKVTSAETLTGPSQALLHAELERLAGKKVHANYLVDPALIGGAMIQLGSTRYDGSVRGQLDGLRRRLSSEA